MCQNIDHLQSWNVLNTPDIICMLLSKLSGSIRDKWSQKILTIQRRVEREPEMDFNQFVNNKTLIVADPVFSKEAVEQYVEKKPSYKKAKFQRLQLEMVRIQMYAVTVMKATCWMAVTVL